jgi:uncharacterized protein (DUF2249 family)
MRPGDTNVQAPAGAQGTEAQGTEAQGTEAQGTQVLVELDVRDMDPPEPMVLTLAALDRLPLNATLVQINTRVPQHLLPQLEARGFTHTVTERAGVVRVAIRHATAGAAQES